MATYSFLNIAASIVGPGGSFQIGGGGAANAEEGVSVEPIEEKDAMTVGADGSIMHSLRASNAARLTVRLLKTSPVNAKLQALYNFQRSSAQLWGNNTIVVSDAMRGDILSLTSAAFARQAPISYAKDGNVNEWTFYGALDQQLGT